MALKAIALNCTLKSSNADSGSSTQKMLQQVLEAMAPYGVSGDIIRVVDQNIRPGVTSDEGAGDAWPEIRRRILGTQILLIGTPVWLGQPSSVCKRVLERMDAFLGEKDEHGRMVSYERVAAVAIVGNEDGAHHVSAELYQALNDVGFTLAANAVAYWVGEAMQKTNYNDLEETPEAVRSSIDMLARNAVHLAQMLQQSPYPGAE